MSKPSPYGPTQMGVLNCSGHSRSVLTSITRVAVLQFTASKTNNVIIKINTIFQSLLDVLYVMVLSVCSIP